MNNYHIAIIYAGLLITIFLIFFIHHCRRQPNPNDYDEESVSIGAAVASDTVIDDVDSISSPSSNNVLQDEEDGYNNHASVKLLKSLPLFSFNSVTGLPSFASLDCAICLSKFEPNHQLRLLPSCCHAFHTQCIDPWLYHNLTCPLCRCAVVFVEDAQSLVNRHWKLSSGGNESSSSSSRSFQLEIGSISLRRDQRSESNITTNDEERTRYYSIGSDFEYVVGDIESDVVVVVVAENTHQRRDEISISVEDEQLPPLVPKTDLILKLNR